MPRIVITHAVQDVERWLGGKAERAAALPGATSVTDLVAMDGSSHAAVMFDIDDLDALKAVLSSVPPELGRAGGVTRGHDADNDRLRRGVARCPASSAQISQSGVLAGIDPQCEWLSGGGLAARCGFGRWGCRWRWRRSGHCR